MKSLAQNPTASQQKLVKLLSNMEIGFCIKTIVHRAGSLLTLSSCYYMDCQEVPPAPIFNGFREKSAAVGRGQFDWIGVDAARACPSRYPYHSGRSRDLDATLIELRRRFPESPLSVAGFSMGGSILLKWLAESCFGKSPPHRIVRAVSVCPPIDLAFTVRRLQVGLARWYDKYFTKACIRDVRRRRELRPDAVVPEGWFERPPQSMQEFDDTFTAPVCGFKSGDDYYAQSSAFQFLPSIDVPTLLIATHDDPVIPIDPLQRAEVSPSITLRAQQSGGHMGFVTSSGLGWLDEQVVTWLLDGV